MFVRTERLLLRPGWLEDAPALTAALADEAIVRNLTALPFPYTLADAESFLSRPADPKLPAMLILARTGRGCRLVGGIGLHHDPAGDIELGYWIRRPFWGLGFATEAGRGMIDLAHCGLGIGRIVSGHFRDNPNSGRVLRKLGFRPTNRIVPRHSLGRGAEVPCVLYAREASDAIPEQDPRALAA